MSSEFLPDCPRLHPGMMVADDSRYEKEWFCRTCGTRLYGNDQGGAELPQTLGDDTADPNNGRPRKDHRPYRTKPSKDQGGRNGAGGKWYQ